MYRSEMLHDNLIVFKTSTHGKFNFVILIRQQSYILVLFMVLVKY